MKQLLAALLSGVIGLSGCATTPVPRNSVDCWRPLLKCGTGESLSFQVSVGLDSTVQDVAPTAPDASREVKRAAKCLVAHPDRLETLIALSPENRPYTFEFAVGPRYCDDALAEPVQ